MKIKIIYSTLVFLMCLLTLSGCILEKKLIREARVLNKNGDICFAIKDERVSRRYPMKISFIEYGNGKGKIGDKFFSNKEKVVPMTSIDCFHVDYKFKKNVFYEVWISGYVNKDNIWKQRDYYQRFYLTVDDSGDLMIHSYPFSREELKRDNPRDPFHYEKLIMEEIK